MELKIEPGLYVVAVSGGIDSVVLLDLLRQQRDVKLIVAHFDHGIRQESRQDRLFVQELARSYDLPSLYDTARLGPAASEEAARKARYQFLHQTRAAVKADAIVTAHHQDDVLETIVLNLMRGTGRKGLSSLNTTDDLVRPLLNHPKQDVVNYAEQYNLQWREDSTNHDLNYARNRIRHILLPSWSKRDKYRLLAIADRMRQVNADLDGILVDISRPLTCREWFIPLPHAVAKEVMASWLRQQGVGDFDHRMIERLTVAAKVASSGKTIDVTRGYHVKIDARHLSLARRPVGTQHI